MTLSLEILDRLIGFETISHQSNLDLIAYIEDFLLARQFRVQRIPDTEEAKSGLYAEFGPQIDGGILLSAHSDVVPLAGQDWTKPAFQLTTSGDRFYGRGTTDMKGFLAEMLAAADAASRRTLKAPLKLLISYDEEIGCIGMSRMRSRLPDLLASPDIAIVGEPTDMRVAIGHKGKRSFRTAITGEAGHSALAPQFISALQMAVDMVFALRGLQTDLEMNGGQNLNYDIPYSTVHVGKMASGLALNIVPDKAELLFEFRHLAEDDPNLLEQRIADAVKHIVTQNAGRGAIKLDLLAAYPGLATAATEQVVELAKSWTGSETCHVAFGTEAGFFAEMGIPTIVCGPGSMAGQGHKPDEYIDRSQLFLCSKMLEKALEHLT